jgi:hypothetical protein
MTGASLDYQQSSRSWPCLVTAVAAVYHVEDHSTARSNSLVAAAQQRAAGTSRCHSQCASRAKLGTPAGERLSWPSCVRGQLGRLQPVVPAPPPAVPGGRPFGPGGAHCSRCLDTARPLRTRFATIRLGASDDLGNSADLATQQSWRVPPSPSCGARSSATRPARHHWPRDRGLLPIPLLNLSPGEAENVPASV